MLVLVITVAFFLVGIKFTNEWVKHKQSILSRYQSEELSLDGITLDNGVTIEEQFLKKNPYSRPGTKLQVVQGIVIHYVGNPGTTAKANRNYFEGLANSHVTSASSHFVVGLEGEIIQCVPINEVAYASNNRNSDTISIEVCHPNAGGKFNKKTYRSVVELTAYLCKAFELTSQDVIRHYDVTGKKCPLYYVENESEWINLKEKIQKKIDAMDDIEIPKQE